MGKRAGACGILGPAQEVREDDNSPFDMSVPVTRNHCLGSGKEISSRDHCPEYLSGLDIRRLGNRIRLGMLPRLNLGERR